MSVGLDTNPMSVALRDALIVGAVRTPVGRGHREKGCFREIHPADLLGRVYEAVLERAGVDPDEVDNVFTGCAMQVAEQSSGIARTAWLEKGLPERTGATTVDIRCGSGPAGPEHRRDAHRVWLRRGRRRRGRRAHGSRRLPCQRRSPGAVGSPVQRGAAGALRPCPPGNRSGDDRRPLGHLPRGDGRALAAIAQAGSRGHRAGPVRTRDPADCRERRHRGRGSGNPRGQLARVARRAEARVQGGREGHRREFVPDLRRRRGAPPHEPREGGRARPAGACEGRRPGGAAGSIRSRC